MHAFVLDGRTPDTGANGPITAPFVRRPTRLAPTTTQHASPKTRMHDNPLTCLPVSTQRASFPWLFHKSPTPNLIRSNTLSPYSCFLACTLASSTQSFRISQARSGGQQLHWEPTRASVFACLHARRPQPDIQTEKVPGKSQPNGVPRAWLQFHGACNRVCVEARSECSSAAISRAGRSADSPRASLTAMIPPS